MPPVSIVNTATVAVPAGITDPNPMNNSSTVTDTLGLFADGFENAVPGGMVLRIEPTTPGLVQRLPLSASDLAALARGAQASEALSIVVADSFAVIQVRRIGSSIELRLLSRDATGRWSTGAWQAFDAGSRIEFEWSTHDNETTRNVLQARVLVSRG